MRYGSILRHKFQDNFNQLKLKKIVLIRNLRRKFHESSLDSRNQTATELVSKLSQKPVAASEGAEFDNRSDEFQNCRIIDMLHFISKLRNEFHLCGEVLNLVYLEDDLIEDL